MAFAAPQQHSFMLPSIALSHKQLVCQRPLPSPPSCLRPASSQTASSRPRLVQQAVVTQQHCEATTSTSSSSTRSSQGWTLPEPLHSSLDLQTSSTRSPQVDIGRGPSSSGRGTGGRLGGPDGNGEDEFAVNFGEAVIVLREDLPFLFERDPRFHIFRDDLTFRTPSMRYSTGLWKYKVLHRAARYLGNLLYADMQLSLTRMWQPTGNRRQLRVRWCVSGRPRLSLSVEDKPQSTEVISTYTFDSKGKIYEHQVDQIIPPESMLVRLFEWLVGQLQPGMTVPQPQLPLPGLRDGISGNTWD